ncbi:TPA: glycine cleavage system aminomethyltransferase GcvT [Candidatus Poribacteria bacterium]|nr:glycine cleavage system aminomethyltransferase GcvT [Candidatus Poribacteria bacterium]HIA67142.1 glycine cleavage system aminomethyltransferase GcvT [Candidatus Poribacteria bacterium]HIB87328.1 glycine cleavage system aminomethyltransferase GcvT [Candidatus Poribacteria bacterium]HIC01272.1 glycine cleavage system aminomethyltransferase GcvT [Candidatus Poribacteria bacterium]HIC19058.1 glycine cleavage system aminomethyltransferase GcvT [Candidatus Poribacteria bacterium]
MSENLKRTPLHHIHKQLGAKLIEFGGWEMPVLYSNIIDEHLTVRSKVGIFDLSHMGEIEIFGQGALKLVQKLITNDAAGKLVDGRVLYSPMCNPAGGIIDDLLVYRLAEDRYMLVVNASNIEQDFEWICLHNSEKTNVENHSDQTVLIALQGQNSPQILQTLSDIDVTAIQYYWFKEENIAGIPVIISRTGYTGEVGFELYVDADYGADLWDNLYKSTIAAEGLPIGLGARDTLRLEAGLPLYGNDIDQTITPLESGLSWTVSLKKEDFIGRDALIKEKKQGTTRCLIGFRMQDRSIARPHYPIYQDKECVSKVTSGGLSPTLGANIGLAYLPTERGKIGSKIEIQIRQKFHPAEVVPIPFYSHQNPTV